MYTTKRAAIFALESIINVVDSPTGYRWEFHPQLPGLLRDYQASGFRLVGVLNPLVFGLFLDSDEEKLELASYINGFLRAAGAPEFEALNLTEDVSDPRPLWDLRRRFGFSLARSIIIGDSPEYEMLRVNAGVGHLEWASSLLGKVNMMAAG